MTFFGKLELALLFFLLGMGADRVLILVWPWLRDNFLTARKKS